MPHPSSQFVIELPVMNHWENVDRLRTSIRDCMSAIFQETDAVESFATVTAELLENAIKYGMWKDPTAKVHLRVSGDAGETRVEVENPVDASSEDTQELIRTIDWLRTFPSAEEAYHAKLLEVAASSSGASRLGLARIAYEGGCELSAEIDGSVLRVTSVARTLAPPDGARA
jgi:hypothetical protein